MSCFFTTSAVDDERIIGFFFVGSMSALIGAMIADRSTEAMRHTRKVREWSCLLLGIIGGIYRMLLTGTTDVIPFLWCGFWWAAFLTMLASTPVAICFFIYLHIMRPVILFVLHLAEKQTAHRRQKARDEAVRRESELQRVASEQKRRQEELDREHFLASDRMYECQECGFRFPSFLARRCDCGNFKFFAEKLVPAPSHIANDHICAVHSDLALGELQKRIEESAAKEDYAGLGNLLLETLTEPEANIRESRKAELWAANILRLLSGRFELDPKITFIRHYREHVLPFELRNDWKRDQFIELMIFAYTLGATWVQLPEPHNSLFEFYSTMATKQCKCLEETKSRKGVGARRYDPSDL